jgi:hypothetical protein
MAVRLVLLAVVSLGLASCGNDKFDQRYRDAEAQIRKEDRDLARELPSAVPDNSTAAQPTEASSSRP